MKGFFVVLAIGLVACVQGQEEQCAAAIAKVPDCAVSCLNDLGSSRIGFLTLSPAVLYPRRCRLCGMSTQRFELPVQCVSIRSHS